jgi:hypothetical protein
LVVRSFFVTTSKSDDHNQKEGKYFFHGYFKIINPIG